MHPRIYCDHPCSMNCGASQPPVSPLPELLASNDIPSELQTAPILDAIQKAKTELARVQAAIANLTAQRAELDDFIQRHTSVVGLRCFPNELLSEIFLRCVDYHSHFDPLTNGPWVVARVCRRWRAVAFSCPRLWRRFFVPEKYPPHIDRFLKMQLDRTRLAPLSIQMAQKHDIQSDDGGVPGVIDVLSDEVDVLGVFLEVASQWEEIQLSEKRHFARFANHGVVYPQLKRLRLNTLFPVSVADLAIVNHDLTSSLPALVHLDWDTFHEPFPRQPRLPWSQLRTLVLRYPQLPDALWMLSLLSPSTDVTPGAKSDACCFDMPRSHVSTHVPTHVLKVQGQFEGGHIQIIRKAAVIRNSGMMIFNQPSIKVQNSSGGKHWLVKCRSSTCVRVAFTVNSPVEIRYATPDSSRGAG
ncbi:hypothetical protein FB45DRAFT_886029 [Roridomyces roridus]|uniref:F-box domain-containing protein n=1 Tax=Roridomyces roridus TaxID=1738132 RepID=A0AAD7CIH9_9AGAR|nr:hypothetical protein FB45DRAFT_937323 [Roridomyces roridus]KAJ7649802.1 hypothetical protein FB45DRAFT_886029 [Roridomyces roridus]